MMFASGENPSHSTSIERLYDTLRVVDVSTLLPLLAPGARQRIDDGDLCVSELLVSAQWLGMTEPEEIFRRARA